MFFFLVFGDGFGDDKIYKIAKLKRNIPKRCFSKGSNMFA